MRPLSDVATVVLENDHVRVVDLWLRPGDKLPMHSHPNYFVHVLAPATVKFTYPDGRSEIQEFGPEQVVWRDAESHDVENVGSTEGHFLVVDIK
jgi:beta-alanine degradation protein BauB